MMIRAFTTLTLLSSIVVACDLGALPDDGSVAVHESAFTEGQELDQPDEGQPGDSEAKPRLSCSNGGIADALQCSDRDECPDVTDEDGVTYDGVCQTLKKADGKYTCGCVRGRKIKGLDAGDGMSVDTDPDSDEASSDDASSDADVATYDDDLAISVPPGDGSKCNNSGNPGPKKCSLRNDCPDVTTDDGITYKGMCGTVKKADGQYTCRCGKGAKKKELAAI